MITLASKASKVYLFGNMRELIATPLFDSCCGGASAATNAMTNPSLYYDSTLGTPITLSMAPANASLPCTCFEINGVGPLYVWNPATASWHVT